MHIEGSAGGGVGGSSRRVELDVVIVGDGPSALVLAEQCRRQHLTVVVIGPRRPWSDLLPAWADDLDGAGASAAVVFAWKAERVTMWGSRRHPVARSFGVLDNTSLARQAANRVTRRRAEVVSIQHFGWGSRATLADGSHVEGKLVVNVAGLGAMGHRPADEPTNGPFRSTLHVVEPDVRQRDVVLMDFRPDGLPGAGTVSFRSAAAEGSGRRVHLTTLSQDPVAPTQLAEALGTEETDGFYRHPIGGVPPSAVTTASFGTAAGYAHPITGYGIASAFRLAPSVATGIARAIADGRRGPRLVQAAWEAVWPAPMRRTRHLHLISVEALMTLEPDAVARFFDGVFEQPVGTWAPYLRIDTPPDVLVSVLAALARRSPWSIRRQLGRRRTFGWRRVAR